MNRNFSRYFVEIPILEFDFEKYEVHQYEGPIAFAKSCVLKEILDREHINEDIVTFLFN